MSRRFIAVLVALCGLLPFRAGAVENWSKLTIGMTTDEAVSAVGQPLVRSVGHGFELWIYDHAGEILVFGNVIGWCAPAAGTAPRQTADIWQADKGKNDFLAVLAMLPPPTPRPTAIARRASVPFDRRPSLRFLDR